MKFCSHFNIENGKKGKILGILCFIISRKLKSQLKPIRKKDLSVHPDGAVTDWMGQKWFVKFCAGDFSLDDAPWVGRPLEVDSDQVKTLRTISENNQCYTMREIAYILKIFKSKVENYLYQLDFLNHFDVCVPHKQKNKKPLDCISACNPLLKCNKNILSNKDVLF